MGSENRNNNNSSVSLRCGPNHFLLSKSFLLYIYYNTQRRGIKSTAEKVLSITSLYVLGARYGEMMTKP